MAFFIWLSIITTCLVREIWKVPGSEIDLVRTVMETVESELTNIEEDAVCNSEFLAVVDPNAAVGCIYECCL